MNCETFFPMTRHGAIEGISSQVNSFIVKLLRMSLTDLPTELVHRLFDLLNAEDVLLSFRLVSRRFSSLVDSYDRLRIESTCEKPFDNTHRLCRLVRPSSVVALDWHGSHLHPVVAECFVQSAGLDQFHRLRSVTLSDIEEKSLGLIIPQLLTLAMLSSVTINTIQSRRWRHDKTLSLLSPLIALDSLRQLTLDINAKNIDDLIWPHQSAVEKLTLRSCTYRQFCEIFDRSPNLHTVVVNNCSMNDVDQNVRPTTNRSLTSLTLKELGMEMNDLEFFLSNHPRLISLTLPTEKRVSWRYLQQFIHWETFLRSKLPHLQKLDLSLSCVSSQFRNVESILAPLCSAFWLEEKQWFFTCRNTKSSSSKQIQLSTFTSSGPSFPDNFNDDKISYAITTRRATTSTRTWTARLDLNWLINNINQEKGVQAGPFTVTDPDYIRHVNRLAFDIDHDPVWSLGSFERLSARIDLAQLEELWIVETSLYELQFDAIEYLLEQTSQLRTFGINYNDSPSRIVKLGRILSGRIDHFRVRVVNLQCVMTTLEHIQRVPNITFEKLIDRPSVFQSIINYLTLKQTKFTIDHTAVSICVQSDSIATNRGLKRKSDTDSSRPSFSRRKIDSFL